MERCDSASGVWIMTIKITDDDDRVDHGDDEIKKRALALGFRLKVQGAEDDEDGDADAYILTDISTGDLPLGADPVSAVEIEKFLDDHAADVGEDDVEIDHNEHLKKVKPPKGADKQAKAIVKAGGQKADDGPIDRFTIEQIKRHNAGVLAARQFARTNLSTSVDDPESDEDYHLDEREPVTYRPTDPLPPDPGEYDPAPKASSGFAVETRKQRVTRHRLLKLKHLADYKIALLEALSEAKRDKIKIGRLLRAAKQIVDHGSFEAWVAAELDISERTAQAFMAAARTQPILESANR